MNNPGYDIQLELPDGVEVESVTFLAFSDNRPTRMVGCGSQDDEVVVAELSPYAARMLTAMLAAFTKQGMLNRIEPDAG